MALLHELHKHIHKIVLDDIVTSSMTHDVFEYCLKELANALVRQRNRKQIHYLWRKHRQQYPKRLPLTHFVSQVVKFVIRLLDAIGTDSKNKRHDYVRSEPIIKSGCLSG